MIHLTNINKHYGSKILYQDASFQIRPGEKIGLVGPNGAGKTTIFRLITGEEGVETGTVSVADKCVVGYFSQNIAEMKGNTILAEVMSGSGKVFEAQKKLKVLEAKLEDSAVNIISDDAMAALLEQYGEAQTEFENLGGYNLEARSQEILTGLGFPPDEHDRMVETYSGGWKMRVALGKILALNPDVLLMDEPTNHLDLETIVWLEQWLVSFKGSLVMTSHDRDFMNRIVSRIVEVANKNITSYSGNYDYYMKERSIRAEQLRASHQKQQDMLAKEEEFIARFAARASHAAQVQSRVKKLDKIDRIEIPEEEETMQFEFPDAQRGGDEVTKFKALGKVYPTEKGTEKIVFKGATGLVRRLDKIAVVGVNGAGKSTLLKLITGLASQTEGELALGPSTEIGYFSQSALDVLDPNKTIYDEVHDRIPNATQGFVRNLLGAFLFKADDAFKKISILSGGEKSRVVLATILAKPVNFLVLDEPTNHLDIKSREVLLEAIQKFKGTVMLVSHDRFFLRSIANRVFELDRHELRIYEGNYEYYTWKRAEEKSQQV